MKKIILFISILSFQNMAWADLLIEPAVGYSFGVVKDKDKVIDDRGIHGFGFGGRLGYEKLGFQLGLDYLNSTLDMKGEDDDFKLSEWGLFAGYRFPLFIRIYAAYLFSANGELGNQEYREGSGSKLGLSFTGIPLINLNFEYRSGQFKELKVGSTTSDIKYDYNAFFVGISIPITI